MNKKMHINLQIISFISILILILCAISAFSIASLQDVSYLKTIIFFFGIVFNVLLVSSELFLFSLLKLKYRLISIGYWIIELIFLVWINSKIPFSGLFILVLFHMIKSGYMIYSFNTIYLFDRFYEYCKIFHIKVKKPRKVSSKKTTAVSKVSKSKSKVVDEKKKVTGTRTAKKTTKSYA